MASKAQVQRLIDAAIAYVELAERHRAHESRITRTLQEAASLARAGKTAEARGKKGEADLHVTEVFDYAAVQGELVEAVMPFRKAEKQS